MFEPAEPVKSKVRVCGVADGDRMLLIVYVPEVVVARIDRSPVSNWLLCLFRAVTITLEPTIVDGENA